MLLCQICNNNQQTPNLTKCCKLFICEQCKNLYEKNLTCICGKSINKKLCVENRILFQIFQQYQNSKPIQCDRCNQAAAFNCKNCQMLFCKTCNQEIHTGLGYSKHIRESFFPEKQPIKTLEHLQKRQEICPIHKLFFELVCQCGMKLCLTCQKSHKQKQNCKFSGKYKSIKQFKQQYFKQIFLKLKKITEYKQKLIIHKNQYLQHFQNQKQLFKKCKIAIQQQLIGLKRILQIRTNQINTQMNEYWNDCENIHSKVVYYAQYNLNKFDDYGKIIQKFAQHQVGLDYLEKRIRPIRLPFNFIHFKTINIDQIQSSLMNLAKSEKRWEFNFNEKLLINSQQLEDKKSIIKKADLASLQPSNPEILLQYTQNPLKPRPITLLSTHNSIHFQFLHLPYQNDTYQVEYGVGIKMKGNQVFKKIVSKQGKGTILSLNPSTKYRIHMRVLGGQWGDIYQIKTLDMPKFAIQNINFSKIINDHTFNFLKQGIIYGTNPIFFGKHFWSITLNSQIVAYEESHTACLSIGVANKQQKKPVFVGSTLNYGYQRQTIVIKVQVDCYEGKMMISNSLNSQIENFNNLPDFPIFPAIQNKSNDSVHIKYTFNIEN